ncbi:hypothetical protein TFKS16_2588 [Tannerella forsythia KS16]|uniref:Uncharacterized protein n=1 Tax=Tannerella forsythia (strain ATCC 43037 / JCM 10827 / CCUG 21028 A / KCTC 5666 / FDC 338) TaxID=203275 RepID=G8UNR4_TANFA|nr:hypothetical protein [Tannerella forsythia]AEW20152.1 hypothetical protein BFO_2866 [Tannerella forsythia 92A2]BAR52771.1 hypothetical protein TFKS16_2588 [Tannerella forsythia KS16]
MDHSFRRSSMGLGRCADGAASRAKEKYGLLTKRGNAVLASPL